MIPIFNDPGPLKIEMSTTLFVAAFGNGTSVTVTGSIVPFITGGYPPYTYDWTDNIANVFVQASTSVAARFQATGTDTDHSGNCILKLTQANGVITTASVVLNFIQGSPP